mmetsp:Transcript_21743/g.53689  ORF Transcript_21743/g.53689 Transcript_21743/m.53689 type:complete len:336 (+) Transcript_21743:1-1008(+)
MSSALRSSENGSPRAASSSEWCVNSDDAPPHPPPRSLLPASPPYSSDDGGGAVSSPKPSVVSTCNHAALVRAAASVAPISREGPGPVPPPPAPLPTLTVAAAREAAPPKVTAATAATTHAVLGPESATPDDALRWSLSSTGRPRTSASACLACSNTNSRSILQTVSALSPPGSNVGGGALKVMRASMPIPALVFAPPGPGVTKEDEEQLMDPPAAVGAAAGVGPKPDSTEAAWCRTRALTSSMPIPPTKDAWPTPTSSTIPRGSTPGLGMEPSRSVLCEQPRSSKLPKPSKPFGASGGGEAEAGAGGGAGVRKGKGGMVMKSPGRSGRPMRPCKP